MEAGKSKRRPSHLPPITRELVFQIADRLKSEKKRVTNETVRTELQGGSLLTIAPLVREWHQEQDQRFRLSLEEVPAEIEEAALVAARTSWKVASNLASQQLIELGKRTQEMEAEHMRQLEEYEGEIRALEAERDTLTGERDQESAKAEGLQTEVEKLKATLQETTQALTLATLREQDAQRYRLQLEAEVKAARDDAAAIAKDAMKTEAKLEIERADRERAEAFLAKAQENAERLASEITTLQKTLTAEQARNRASSEKVIQLSEQVESERAERERLAGELSSTSKELEAARLARTELEVRVLGIHENVTQLTAQLAHERIISADTIKDLREALEAERKQELRASMERMKMLEKTAEPKATAAKKAKPEAGANV